MGCPARGNRARRTAQPTLPAASFPSLPHPHQLSGPIQAHHWRFIFHRAQLICDLEPRVDSDFENLVAEIESAGLTEKLKKEELTLLAPSDDAFNALSDDVFERFSESKNRQKVLQYHLISGKVSQKDIDRGGLAVGFVEVSGQLPQHSRITINRADRRALRIGQRRQPVIRAKYVRGPIDEIEMLLLCHKRLLAVVWLACKPQEERFSHTYPVR